MHFGIIVGSFWDEVGVDFKSFCDDFEFILGVRQKKKMGDGGGTLIY